MQIAGVIQKMRGTLDDSIQYVLPIGMENVPINAWIGKQVQITHHGEIFCVSCQRRTKKSYQQGYCFVCAQKLACCDLCIVRPETCHYHLGTCREPQWGEKNCFIPHKIYLANTTGLKVGISRAHTLLSRWIDQGAIQAMPLLVVHNRRQAGLVEVMLAKVMADKTNWRALLRGASPVIDLAEIAQQIRSQYGDAIAQFQEQWGREAIQWVDDVEPLTLNYPVAEYPHTIRSIDLEKCGSYTGTLRGIKGQYLLWEDGAINIRKYTGFDVSIEVRDEVR